VTDDVVVPGRLLIFCGIPGSGKTSIARLVAKADPGAIHIQTDSMRAMIPAPTYSAEESDLVYRMSVAAAKDALDSGRLVILDGTFGSRRRREVSLSSLEGHYSRVDFVHVVCDLETALRRNSARSAAVPPENLRSILLSFDPPEGALVVDSSITSPEESAGLVTESLLYPFVPPE
jgi:predicted kinase